MTKEEIFNRIPFLDKNGDFFNMQRTHILEAMQEYATQYNHGWVKITPETMPPHRIDVFVYNSVEDKTYIDYYSFEDDMSSFNGWYRSNSNHITHWMLPAKPES